MGDDSRREDRRPAQDASPRAAAASAGAAHGLDAQRLRVALASSPTRLFEQDLDLRYTWIFSPEMGYTSREQVLGRTDAEITDAAHAPRIEAIKRQVLASGIAARERVPASAPGGPVGWYDLTVEPRRDETGRIVGVIGAATDITATLAAEAEAKAREAALRESESRLRLALQGANAVAWRREIATDVIEFSAEAESVYDRAEWTPRTYDEFVKRIHPDDRAAMLAAIGEARRKLKPFVRDEYRILLPDGQIKSLLTLAKLERDDAGAPLRVFGITLDVTGQKSAEAALRESESRLRLALHGANAAAWRREIATGEIEFLAEAESVYDRAEWAPRTFDEFVQRIHPDDRAATLDAIRDATRNPNPFVRDEYRILLPDGRIKSLLTLAKLERDEAGAPVKVFGISVDVTGQKTAEAALRESETRLRLALEGANAAAWQRDLATGEVQFSSEGAAIFERADGGPASFDEWLENVHPDDRAATLAALKSARERGQPFARIEYRLLFPDGRIKWVLSLGKAALDGAETHNYGILIDVTEQKLAEAARRESEEQLRTLNAELAERVEREVRARQSAQATLAHAEKMAALGQLAGGMAHDFNNVLQAVLTSAAVIQRRPGDPGQVRSIAERIEEAARRGAAITGRLLAFARRDDLSCEAVDVGSVLADLAAMLKSTAAPGIRFVLDIPPNLPGAITDRGQLETALVNLATNAADAIAGDGSIAFSAREERALERDARGLEPGAYVRIDVRDDGVGMDEDTLSHMFEPFFTTKEVGKGTGLGLPTARSFARRSGGALAVASRLGQGTTATVWLPVAAARERAEESGAAAASPNADPAGPVRVLLVDDERFLREMLALDLGDRGFAVEAAEGGAEALARLDAGLCVDAIVSDLAMPGTSGLAFLAEARRRLPGIPAIILTGNTGAIGVESLESIGARVSLVRKPVSGGALAAALADLLRGV